MRICILTHNNTLNDDRLYYKLGRSLAKIGEIYILNPTLVNEEGNPKHVAAQKSIKKRKEKVKWFVQKLNNLKPKIIIVNHPFFLPIASSYKKYNEVKIVYDPAEDWGNMIKELSSFFWLKNWIILLCVKWIECIHSKNIDLVITTDNWLESFYSKKFKTLQLFNYPNYSMFNNYISKCNNHSLVYHGQLIKERGIFDLIHATYLLKNKFSDITLNLIGWFTKYDEEVEAKRLVNTLDISQHVNFINPVDHTQIPKLISRNSIGVVPLHNIRKFQHNIPTKVFEYAACGLQIMSSNLAPTKQLKNSDKWCTFYEAGNIDSLVESISNILEANNTFNSEGRDLFEKEFNWETQEESLLEMVKGLVQ